MEETRILVVDDEQEIADLLELYLISDGYQVIKSGDALEGLAIMEREKIDLVLLDIMLPEEDGLEILRKIRGRREIKNLPVIMLTAKGTEYDQVVGLDNGADDYVAKPFGMMELISRIKALMRRTAANGKNDEYTADGLYVCPSKHIVKANGKEVVLTYKEFELLCLLISNKGTVFNRDQILQRIWGFEFDGENRTVDVHIRTLRTKLGECGALIETVRGIGYKIGG